MPYNEVFCSISTPGYLGKTMVCLRSLHQQHPTSCIRLLLLDTTESDRARLPREPWLYALGPEDVGLAGIYAELHARYSVAERCFALKPYLMAALLDQGFTQVHYLDGDCQVYRPLTALLDLLSGADLLLTPHVLAPVPDDRLKPEALTLLRGGVFNGGYLGVRGTVDGRAFLGWLAEMTREQAFNQPKLGMCGDQRWLDLAPVLFPGTAICRLRGANAAYWNLHDRPLGCPSAENFTVGGEPLLFFHFSGFDEDRPRDLSRYQNRHIADPASPLALLLEGYVARIAAEDREYDPLRAKRLKTRRLRVLG